MRLFVLAGLMTLGIAAVASAQDAKAKGAQLFVDQKCGLCHAIAGKGNAKGALDDVGSKLKADEIRSWITDPKGMATKTNATRKPPMPLKAMPKEDVDALVAYLSTLKGK